MRQVFFVLTLAVSATSVSLLDAQQTQDKPPQPEPPQTAKAPTERDAIKRDAAEKDAAGKMRPKAALFDGKDMKGWGKAKGIDYEDSGAIEVKNGSLILGMGDPATGIRWTGKFPKTNYEVELEGQRVEGTDFFCGMSFPVGDGALTLILGGWGGWMTGLSCVDGYRADENETCSSTEFKNKQWYRIRVRVTKKHVSAYVDDQQICELEIKHRKLAVTYEMEPCLPFGFATWYTTGAPVQDTIPRATGHGSSGGQKSAVITSCGIVSTTDSSNLGWRYNMVTHRRWHIVGQLAVVLAVVGWAAGAEAGPPSASFDTARPVWLAGAKRK